jgi:hypothetical protein
LAFKSFLNNFLDFINNSEKETFIRIPCSPRLLARKPISSFPFHSAQPTRLGVISYLTSKLSLSSTTCRRLVEPPWLSRLPRAPLFMADHYHSLISAIITIYSLYSLRPLIPVADRYRVPHLGAPSLSPINRPPRPHRSPHLPHLSLPLF